MVVFWGDCGFLVGWLALVREGGREEGREGRGEEEEVMAQMSFSLAVADMITLVNWYGRGLFSIELLKGIWVFISERRKKYNRDG